MNSPLSKFLTTARENAKLSTRDVLLQAKIINAKAYLNMEQDISVITDQAVLDRICAALNLNSAQRNHFLGLVHSDVKRNLSTNQSNKLTGSFHVSSCIPFKSFEGLNAMMHLTRAARA